MYKYIYHEDVLGAIKRLSITDYKILSEEELAPILSQVLDRFTTLKEYEFPLWENVISEECFAIRDEDSWMWMTDFPTQEPSILIFEYRREKRGFEFQRMEDLVNVLGESCNFVFYITSRKIDYLLSQNDHDYLIAAGRAKPWLIDYLEQPRRATDDFVE